MQQLTNDLKQVQMFKGEFNFFLNACFIAEVVLGIAVVFSTLMACDSPDKVSPIFPAVFGALLMAALICNGILYYMRNTYEILHFAEFQQIEAIHQANFTAAAEKAKAEMAAAEAKMAKN